MNGVKIATCCYCGTRAALVLTGRERHELSCRSCGAPLSAMKQLKVEPQAERRRMPAAAPPRREKPRRKGAFRRVWDEALDELGDLFD